MTRKTVETQEIHTTHIVQGLKSRREFWNNLVAQPPSAVLVKSYAKKSQFPNPIAN